MNNIDMVNDVNIAYEQVQKAAYCDLKGTNPVHIFLFTFILNEIIPFEFINFILVLFVVLFYPPSVYPVSILVLLYHLVKKDEKEVKRETKNSSILLEKKTFLTNFKALISFLTVNCILAVDFQIFPRNLAKTETYGISLMDLGVGAVIFSMGLTSSKLLEKRLKSVLVNSSVVGLLGILRTFVIKYFNYQEHVTEYGEHWNFFLTLAIVPVIVYILKRFMKTVNYFPLFFFLLQGIVMVLCRFYRIENYIMSDHNRVNLIERNREGLYSLIGYVSIYLMSSFIGKDLYLIKGSEQWRRFRKRLLLLSVLFLVMSSALLIFDYSSSRRCANTAYVFWTITICGWQLFFLLQLEEKKVKRKFSLYEMVCKYQLGVFLLGNILTGLINMRYKTLLIEWWKALIIMLLYNCTIYTGLNLIEKFYQIPGDDYSKE